MADIGVTNNRLATALDLGELVFTDGRDAASITFTDTVGSSFVSFDRIDYFEFTPIGVDEVTVTFSVQAEGDYANVLYFTAHEGRSRIDGDVSWSAAGGALRDNGSDRSVSTDGAVQSDFHTLATDYADALRDDAGNDFDGAYRNATAALNSRDPAEAVWTLTGDTVGFQALGMQLNQSGPNDNRSLGEITYTVTITATAGQDLGVQPRGQEFSTLYLFGGPIQGDDRFNVFKAHEGPTNFDVSRTGEDAFTVTYLPGSPRADQTFRLENIELIETTNGYITLETDGMAGEVYRLYQAAFDRTPDAEGLGFWLRSHQDGAVDMLEMAEYFIGSEEFADTYGAPATVDDASFLTLLYGNVLDRTPDEAGFAFWEDQQSGGMTRAEMLGYFSESAENIANVAGAIEDGIWYL